MGLRKSKASLRRESHGRRRRRHRRRRRRRRRRLRSAVHDQLEDGGGVGFGAEEGASDLELPTDGAAIGAAAKDAVRRGSRRLWRLRTSITSDGGADVDRPGSGQGRRPFGRSSGGAEAAVHQCGQRQPAEKPDEKVCRVCRAASRRKGRGRGSCRHRRRPRNLRQSQQLLHEGSEGNLLKSQAFL